MMRAWMGGLAAWLLLTAGVQAQNGNTVLSRYGGGEMQLPLTARNRGMGWTGTALRSGQDISMSNPALWADLTGLRLQGDGTYETETFALDNSLSYGSFGIKGLQFAFPVEEQLRTRVVAGFLPASRVGYDITGTGMLGDEPFTAEYSGSGGISLFRFGAAMRPLSWASVGIAYQYFFGSSVHASDVRFTNGTYYPSVQTRSDAHGGSGFIAGLVVEPIDDLSVGLAVQGATGLNITRRNVVEYSTHDSTVTGLSGVQDLPLRLSAGLTYRAHRAWLLAADVTLQDWTDARVFDGKQSMLGRSYRLGAGFEWTPAAEESRLKDDVNSIVYRAGFAHQISHVRLDGKELPEYFITAGAGLPITGQNRVDLALEYGWRGSDGDTLGKRSVFRLSLSVSVGEFYFVRRAAD